MAKNCDFKIVYEKDKTTKSTVLLRGNLFQYPSYQLIYKEIIEKASKNNTIKLTKHDKFILNIENYKLAELDGIWDDNSYSYLYERLQQNPQDSIRFKIKLVKEYPIWNHSNYDEILKESLNTAWNESKKKITDELTKNFLEEGKRVFIENKIETEENTGDCFSNEIHSNIICNNCLNFGFYGLRYVCCECNNFNLCESCKKNIGEKHNPEHTFIRFKSRIEEDIQKYSSIFNPNKKLCKQEYESFEIKIEIINNGKEPLRRCFLSPIRFGNNYLGCMKTTIKEKCEKGEKISLDVLIKFEDLEEQNHPNYYEGYFRLLTRDGIPFGDILYLKVLLNNK